MFNKLKKEFKHMVKSLDELLQEIAGLPEEHGIDEAEFQKEFDEKAAAITSAVADLQTKASATDDAVAANTKTLTDHQTVLETLLDKLSEGNTQGAIAVAQGALDKTTTAIAAASGDASGTDTVAGSGATGG